VVALREGAPWEAVFGEVPWETEPCAATSCEVAQPEIATTRPTREAISGLPRDRPAREPDDPPSAGPSGPPEGFAFSEAFGLLETAAFSEAFGPLEGSGLFEVPGPPEATGHAGIVRPFGRWSRSGRETSAR